MKLWVQGGYRVDRAFKAWRDTRQVCVEYLSDGKRECCNLTESEWDKWQARKYPNRKTPGRFMYKSLARIWLEVVKVWVERVQEIGEEDAIAEGVIPQKTIYIPHPLQRKSKPRFWTGTTECSHRESFQILWDRINAKRGYPWEANDWVFVEEFKRTEKP